jgi:hypothetical protein
VEHDLVSPTRCDDLPIAPAERSIRPPAILDQPRFAHRIDLATIDLEWSAVLT